jgi:hypothetical protein
MRAQLFPIVLSAAALSGCIVSQAEYVPVEQAALEHPQLDDLLALHTKLLQLQCTPETDSSFGAPLAPGARTYSCREGVYVSILVRRSQCAGLLVSVPKGSRNYLPAQKLFAELLHTVVVPQSDRGRACSWPA